MFVKSLLLAGVWPTSTSFVSMELQKEEILIYIPDDLQTSAKVYAIISLSDKLPDGD